MKYFQTALPFFLIGSLFVLQTLQAVDYSQNGKNWADPLCSGGSKQSPINIDSQKTSANQFIRYVFNYMSIENATLMLSDNNTRLKVDMSMYGRTNTLQLWNEYGELYNYFLDSFRWKVPSEHTIDNRQYGAEL